VHEESPEILIFEVGEHRYGLPADSIQEIVRAVAIVSLSRGLAGVEGVVNFRGRVVPVLDLRRWLGLAVKAVEPSDHLIFARFQTSLLAIRVDRVIELLALNTTTVRAGGDDPEDGRGFNRVADLGGCLVPIIDLQDLFEAGDRDSLGSLLDEAATPLGQDARS